MKAGMTVSGTDDIERLLERIAPKEAQKIMRDTHHSIAMEIAKDARKNMSGTKDTGEMQRQTRARRARAKEGKMISTVNVGTGRSKNAPFYWRFLEYGQGPDGVEHAFFGRALKRAKSEHVPRFLKAFGKRFEQAAKRAAKREARGK
jgi:HK97 gp10 family phage protein